MKKWILLLFLTLGSFLFLEAKSLGSLFSQPHITVTQLPVLGASVTEHGPFVMFFRCTNHTAAPLPLEITVLNRNREKIPFRISKNIQLPGLSTSEVSISVPFTKCTWSPVTFEAFSNAGGQLKLNKENIFYERTSQLTSPSFAPDFFEYLFEKFSRASIPVSEWPADYRAYGGRNLIVLDSMDPISPALRKALLLAAAQGTHILTLVQGNAPWPLEAGAVPLTARKVVQPIGFGSWTYFRTQAVSSNPRWKNFAKKKQALLKKHGAWHNTYRRLKWEEESFYKCLNARNQTRNLHNALSIPPPPVPLTALCVIMVCFVLLIGPVNFLVLKRYHKELWSLVTIPVLSLIFSGTVVLSVLFSEGFYSKGKASVETFIDQRTGLTASRGSFAIYAPIASSAFKFDADDLLYFHDPGTIRGEVKDKYIYSSGLLRSRMSFSYAVSRAGFRSEKIAVSEKNGSIEIVNGLGVPLTECLLKDGSGKLFRLQAPLAPGARASLKPSTPQQGDRVPQKNCYTAQVSKPFFITCGATPDKYEYKETIKGIWR